MKANIRNIFLKILTELTPHLHYRILTHAYRFRLITMRTINS